MGRLLVDGSPLVSLVRCHSLLGHPNHFVVWGGTTKGLTRCEDVQIGYSHDFKEMLFQPVCLTVRFAPVTCTLHIH